MIQLLIPIVPLIIEGVKIVGIGMTIKNIYDTGANLFKSNSIISDADLKLSEANNALDQAKHEYENKVNYLLQLNKKVIEKLSEIDVNWRNGSLFDRIDSYVYKELNSVLDSFNVERDHRTGIIKAKDVIITGTLGTAAASFTPGIVKCTLEEIAIQIGKTSTGKAISTLSGIAQKNAIYAWLGGGAKATGGLGVEGGKAFVGGLSTASVFSIATTALSILSTQILNNAKQKAMDIYNKTQEKLIKAEFIKKETEAKSISIRHLVNYINKAYQLSYLNPERAKIILIGTISHLNFLLKFDNFSFYETKLREEISNAVENTLRSLANGYCC